MKTKRIVSLLVVLVMVLVVPLTALAAELPVTSVGSAKDPGGVLETRTQYGTGLYKVNGVWRYYENGKFTKATGLVRRADNKRWVYVENGLFSTKTTITKKVKDDGKWYYVEDGHFKTATGLAKRLSDGKWLYIRRGAYTQYFTGLCKRISDGTWFYVKNGSFNKYTGLVWHKKHFFYVRRGALDWNYNGDVTHNGRNYVVKKGVASLKPYYNLIRPTSTKALGSKKVKPNAGTILRYGPSANYGQVKKIPKGVTLKLEASKKYTIDTWFYTKYDGRYGWVSGKDLG